MATRIPEPEPWTRISAVLAEAAGEGEDRSFDDQAVALAKTMRGVRHDWAGKPTITWTMAEELLVSLRAEQARVVAAIEQQAVAADEARRAAMPKGIPWDEVPAGLDPAQMMMLSDPDMRRARRETVLEHSLSNPAGAILYHSINEDES
jgi:hypothetical protein